MYMYGEILKINITTKKKKLTQNLKKLTKNFFSQ